MSRVAKTPMVKIALAGLRIYTLAMVVLLGIKFAEIIHTHYQAKAPAPTQAQVLPVRDTLAVPDTTHAPAK